MSFDLWDEKDPKGALHSKPKTVKVPETNWEVPMENLPKPAVDIARRRVYSGQYKPNKRAAVPEPIEGQSYNPDAVHHEEAVSAAVAQLTKRQRAHEKFVRTLNYKGEDLRNERSKAPNKKHRSEKGNDGADNDSSEDENETKKKLSRYSGGLEQDGTWEEEVNEFKKRPTTRRELTEEQKKRKMKEEKKKRKKAKQLNKLDVAKQTRLSRKHRAHPDRDAALADLEKIDKVAEEARERAAAQELKGERRKARKLAGDIVPKYGRHVHQPMVLDVLPSTELVGCLRHIKGGAVAPALQKMKSLEERGLVPARMRHSYNRRTVYKPKGEVTVVKEPIGRQ